MMVVVELQFHLELRHWNFYSLNNFKRRRLQTSIEKTSFLHIQTEMECTFVIRWFMMFTRIERMRVVQTTSFIRSKAKFQEMAEGSSLTEFHRVVESPLEQYHWFS